MDAIILAAGRASRFPDKLLAPIDGEPLIAHNIAAAKSFGAEKCYVAVSDYTNWGVIRLVQGIENTDILYIANTQSAVETFIRAAPATCGNILLMLADTYVSANNCGCLTTFHANRNPAMTICCVEDNSSRRIRESYSVKCDEDYKVTHVAEHPVCSKGLRGCGIYLCSPDAIAAAIEEQCEEQSPCLTRMIARCIAQGVYAFPLDGVCLNINREQDIPKAIR